MDDRAFEGRGPSRLACVALGAAVVALAGAAELAIGRRLWGISGEPGLWSGDIGSSHNSQYLFDPYTFSHVTHGLALYGFVTLAARRLPIRLRVLLVLALEAGWEMIENTDVVIQRYRAATISLNYYGDSVVNSMGDVLACLLGASLAAILPTRVSVVAAILLEVGLAFWIRDGLALNVLMLIQPVAAIRTWQLGH